MNSPTRRTRKRADLEQRQSDLSAAGHHLGGIRMAVRGLSDGSMMSPASRPKYGDRSCLRPIRLLS